MEPVARAHGYGQSGGPDRSQDSLLTVHFHVSLRQRCLHPDLTLHVWGPAAEGSAKTISKNKSKAGHHWFGETFYLKLGAEPSSNEEMALGLELKEGDQTFGKAELKFSQMMESKEVWIFNDRVLLKEPDPRTIPIGDHQRKARAHWLSRHLIALRFDWGRQCRPPKHFWSRSEADETQFQFFLHVGRVGELLQDCGSDGLQGSGRVWKLTPQQRLTTEDLKNTNVPFLAGCLRLLVPEEVDPRELCQQHLAVSVKDSDGKPVDCTGLQIGHVLDQFFAYDGPLGCHPVVSSCAEDSGPKPFGGTMEFALWAPNALNVELLLTEDPLAAHPSSCVKDTDQVSSKVERIAMYRALRSADDGVWRCRSRDCWGKFYVYRIHAYHPETGRFETMVAPDPYSTACAADSSWSMVCHLPSWKEVLPDDVAAWQNHAFLPEPEEAAIYELHVRDFSMSDPKVPQNLRGKFSAFAEEDSLGHRHLLDLADAGITHVQLLPAYDFGSVPERVADRIDPPWMAVTAGDSEEPQDVIAEVAEVDSFNWGYDPVLYNVPEGSYASNPDDGSRIKEFRQMVAALHKKKLGVVMDVVFNHTLGSGPENPKSVLDKCVPGYYHRRAEDGSYEHSTCANNTATEHYMMGRLVCDSVLHWVTQYHVDGFRFDLMGHIPLKVMRKVRDLLDSLRVEMHGFDGRRIMLYGEGWEFGEVANGQRGPVAVQQQLHDTKIGAFNDRIRDATLGGSPFVDPRLQGFATGLLMRENPGPNQGSIREQEARLRKAQDTIRISLAGSLKDFSFQNFKGETLHGHQHFNEGLAYANHPVEAINYVSAHDNETLFDNTVWKMLPGHFTSTERMRANWLATSLIALAHGVPFFHAGDELLRSKSLDRDSYNSGDWFNVLDFSGEKSSFGVGLPPKGKNGHHWDLMRPILRDKEAVRPTVEMVEATKAKFLELLRLRRSTKLLGLKEAKDIKEKVNFPGCGPLQKLGLIVMQICNDKDSTPLTCSHFARVVVVFWAGLETTRVSVPRVDARLNGGRLPLRLHPLQQSSHDEVTRGARVDGEQLVIPAQTTAVFVEPLADPK